FFQEKPQTLLATEREEQSSGVAALQEPNVQAVGHSSLCTGHESSNGHGTAQNSHSRMVGPVSDFTNPLRPQSSRGYATPARRSDDVGESEAAGLESMRSVTRDPRTQKSVSRQPRSENMGESHQRRV